MLKQYGPKSKINIKCLFEKNLKQNVGEGENKTLVREKKCHES